ncbi:MAG: hypothetical protein JWM38_2570 [Sphingomonas bacterium]|nr:hypothetical protein [Sphingomonas bacterium]MDB5719143.1 hypothetical protein [Sphingomonas bacterium]
MADDGKPMRLMQGDDTLSPVDLPGSTMIGGRPLLWTSIVIATATAFLALTNAITIDGWAKELPAGPVAARVIAVTEGWVTLTDRAGLGAPRAFVHRQWKKAEALRFD